MNSVGNFFVKIGLGIKKGFFGLINWIKNTAWIQPLLIVGVIFGVILSIKPVTEWVGGLLNPDETYAFYNEHNAKNLFTQDQIETFIKNNKGDTIIVYYSDANSTCADMEKELRRVSSNHSSFDWRCVNINITDTNSDEYKDKENFYVETYQDWYLETLSKNKYPSMVNESGLSSFDIDEKGIPTPMFVRLSGSEIVGVKVDFSEDDRVLGIERFLSSDIENDWTKSWEDYKNDKNN